MLWVLCDYLKFRGIKFGCGIGSCGVCMVYIDGWVRKVCIMKVLVVVGLGVIMIEGLVGIDGMLYLV